MDAEKTLAASESQQNTKQSDWPSLETITKTLSLSAVLSYALGLVVQNVYLASFGVSDFDLLKAKSILTGILCAVLLAVGAIPTFLVYIVAFFPGMDASPKKRRIAARILVVCMSFAAFLALREYDQPAISLQELHEVAWLATTRFTAGIMAFVSLLSSIVFLETAKRSDTPKERLHDLLSAVAVNCAFMTLGLPGIYAAFPAEFGGGRPTPVVLILTEDGRKVWHHLSHKYEDSQDPFVQLVYEREKTLLVRDNTHFDSETGSTVGSTVIVLDKALVQAFIPRPGKYDASK